MRIASIALILSLCGLYIIGLSNGTSSLFCDSRNRLNAYSVSGFCPVVWASRLASPRGLKVASNGDVLVIERAKGAITVLWDDNKNGVSDQNERATIATLSGLNHGIAIDQERRYLYASTAREVYRWRYTAGRRTPLLPGVRVIQNIPCCHHMTRTLLIRPDGSLLVTVGSAANVDDNDLHARIHLFRLTDLEQVRENSSAIDWRNGVVFARGMRNEVGLNYDKQGRVWGVENGVDDLNRPDLGRDLVYNNPGEEVNLFSDDEKDFDKFYGYPYCWSENFLPPSTRKGKGTQWAHPHFMHTGRPQGSDEWCQNPNNVVKPAYQLPAHSAPLDILFYSGTTFPSEYVNDSFVALHGSWDRVDPVGYAVVRLHFQNNMPVRHSVFLANPSYHKREENEERNAEANKNEQEEGKEKEKEKETETETRDDDYPEPPSWQHRPVGLGVGPCGVSSECLYVSSDASNIIMAVAYGD